jgi:hypothetical protein
MSTVDVTRFEPQSPVDLIKMAFGQCFGHGGAAFIAAALMMLPATALNLAFSYLMGQTGALSTLMSMQGGQVDPTQFDMGEFLGAMAVVGGGGVAVGIVSLLSSFAAAAAVGRMLAERALGRPFGPAQAWDWAMGKLWRLTGGAVVAGVTVAVGYVIASIPVAIVSIIVLAATGGLKAGTQPSPIVQGLSNLVMIPFLVALAAYTASMPSIVAVEDLGGLPAVFRSFRLVAGRFRQAATAIGLGGLILLGLPAGLQMVMQFGLMERLTEAMGGGPGMLAAFGPGTVLGSIAWPILFCLQTLIYFDLRSRQTEEEFTPYVVALELGGELPEGVRDPLDAESSEPSAIS